MGFGEGLGWIGVAIQIFFVDLLLGADNALVIGLACRALRPADARAAAFLGAGGAIALRLALTAIATSLLGVPLVKLVGASALMVIALNVAGERRPRASDKRPSLAPRGGLWSAALAIVVADAAMSLDNVVALAAIANGNFWVLLAGVAFSIPVLAYGGLIFLSLLRKAPYLIAVGAALLGWIAGQMAVSDPLVADWANVNAPALVAVAPALAAAFVWLNRRPRGSPAAPPENQGALAPPRPRPARADDRVTAIRVLILAAIAGVALMLVSFIDSLN